MSSAHLNLMRHFNCPIYDSEFDSSGFGNDIVILTFVFLGSGVKIVHSDFYHSIKLNYCEESYNLLWFVHQIVFHN